MRNLFHNKRLRQGFLLVVMLGFLFKLTTSSRNSEETRMLDEFWSRYSVHAVPIPDDMEFAGEQVPLEDLEVRERVDRELLVNTYFQSSTVLSMKRSARWFPVFEPILKQYGVPDDFKYLAVIESGLANLVSPSQAAGFWQFVESTGRAYGLKIEEGIDERYDPIRSTHAACRFLLDAKREFGSWAMAAAAYNMGTNGLRKQVQQQGLSQYYELWLNQETSRYLPRLIATKYIFEHPKSYGYRLTAAQKYGPLTNRTIKIDTAIKDVAQWARSMGYSYKVLRAHNPWIRSYSLPSPGGSQPYTFRLPEADGSLDLPELSDLADSGSIDSVGYRSKTESMSTQSSQMPSAVPRPEHAATQAKRRHIVRHKVTEKQKIEDVAKMFGVTVTEIVLWNSLENTRLVGGQTLKIELSTDSSKSEGDK